MNSTEAIDQVVDGLEKTLAGFRALRMVLSNEDQPQFEFNPADPANKQEIGGVLKLTPRGEEICYRLFDAGKSRYAVAQLMGISFGAATHRHHAWQKAGGVNREKRSLSPNEGSVNSDPTFERQMAVARDVMQRRFAALRELAK